MQTLTLSVYIFIFCGVRGVGHIYSQTQGQRPNSKCAGHCVNTADRLGHACYLKVVPSLTQKDTRLLWD